VGNIKIIEGSITGIDDVYNYSAFTNGKEEESNEDFAARGLLALQGVSVGTEAGYISKILENIYVYDALVVGPGDELMVRDDGLGGKIDIYVKIDKNSTDVYTQITETFTYNGETEKILSNVPVKQITSVEGSISGVLSENTDWKFVEDTGEFKGSIDAVDKIEFLTSLDIGEEITITYDYFDIVQTLVTLVEDVRPITADVMVKLASEVPIDVTARITADSTITDKSQLENDIQTELESFLTFKDLDGKIEQSDIIQLIHNIDGVDNVIVPLDKLAKQGETGVGDIDFKENEYPVPGNINITVS